MKKRILSILTAAICTISTTLSLNVSADTFMEYPITTDPYVEDLLVLAKAPYLTNVILVHTDGTELTEDMVSGFEGYSALYTWEYYGVYISMEIPYMYDEITEDPSDLIPCYDCLPDADQDGEPDKDNNYCIVLSEGYDDEASLQNFAKQLMLTYDFVEESYLFYTCAIEHYHNQFSFAVEKQDEELVLDMSMFPELGDDFEIETYTYNEVEYNSITFVGEEEGHPLFEKESTMANDQSYELYQRWTALGEQILADHSDILSSVTLKCEVSPLLVTYKGFYETEPVWQTAGDHNADGETNSNDAAALLVQAAEDGAAEASAETVSPDSDVNLDGVADSTDAAYILQYSALKGAGMDPDWVEILKK